MSNFSISQYRGNQISSATPEKTVLMLYEGAIRFIGSAIKEIEENNNIPEKSRFLEKAVKIIDHLQSCLDQERGGIIAENLDKLYDYMSIRLTEANLRNDVPKMEEIINLLLTVRDGWKGICGQSNGNCESPESSAAIAALSQTERKIGVKV